MQIKLTIGKQGQEFNGQVGLSVLIGQLDAVHFPARKQPPGISTASTDNPPLSFELSTADLPFIVELGVTERSGADDSPRVAVEITSDDRVNALPIAAMSEDFGGIAFKLAPDLHSQRTIELWRHLVRFDDP